MGAGARRAAGTAVALASAAATDTSGGSTGATRRWAQLPSCVSHGVAPGVCREGRGTLMGRASRGGSFGRGGLHRRSDGTSGDSGAGHVAELVHLSPFSRGVLDFMEEQEMAYARPGLLQVGLG